MREIKFRAWHKEKHKMFGVQKMSFKTGKILPYGWNMEHDGVEFELMQYTGLKDKNGKEVFEGDIVKEQNMLSVCIFLDDIGAYAFIPIELYKQNRNDLYLYSNFHLVYNLFEEYGTDCFFDNDVPHKYVEVIGNIFQNPELLEVGE